MGAGMQSCGLKPAASEFAPAAAGFNPQITSAFVMSI